MAKNDQIIDISQKVLHMDYSSIITTENAFKYLKEL